MTSVLVLAVLGVAAAGSACAQSSTSVPADSALPAAARPVARISSTSWDTESSRDRVGEAERVFTLLAIGPGTRVADIGAGAGYYTTRLARKLGPGATIYAQDISQPILDSLRSRLARERLAGVTLVLGTPGDPKLPPTSVDLALLSHMYHEIARPYDFLYNLHPALAPNARVAVIDSDKPTESHGTPPALLRCEMAALGYRELSFDQLTPASGYLAVFAAPDSVPGPSTVTPCTA
jgi:ubiquinone/menaquinone biosynthesis C-methylase UbiE